MADAAWLAGNGSITANYFGIRGEISPDNYIYSPLADLAQNSSNNKTGSAIGQLTLNGDVNLNGALLTIDVDGAANDKINVNSLTHGAAKSIIKMVGPLSLGTYDVVVSASVIADPNVHFNLKAASSVPGDYSYVARGSSMHRNAANTILQVTLDNTQNIGLTWNGNGASHNWSAAAADANWTDNPSGLANETRFMNGDMITFAAGAGSGKAVLTENITVGKLSVIGNDDYTLSGNHSIQGRPTAALAGADGSFFKGGNGALWLRNQGSHFDGDIEVAAGTLGLASNLSTAQSFTSQAGGTIAFEVSLAANKIDASAITISGPLLANFISANAMAAAQNRVTVVAEAQNAIQLNTLLANRSSNRYMYDYVFKLDPNDNKKLLLIVIRNNASLGGTPGLSPNAQNMSNTLDAHLAGGGTLAGALEGAYLDIAGAQSAIQAAAILNRISPDVLTRGSILPRTVLRTSMNRVGSYASQPLQNNYSSYNGLAVTEEVGGWRTHIHGIGSIGKLSDHKNAPGYDLTSFGGGISMDYTWENFRLGGALQASLTGIKAAALKATASAGLFMAVMKTGPGLVWVNFTLGKQILKACVTLVMV